MPRKLTKRMVEGIRPRPDRDLIEWDTELHGFGVRVWPSGKRAYFVKYRTKDGRQRKPNIGIHGVWTAEQARDQARQWLAEAARGEDPASASRAGREAPSMAEFAERYLRKHARLHKKASSVANDERLLASRILTALGARTVGEIGREDVERLHEGLRDTPYQANRVLALLSKMFNLAEEWSLRPEGTNPCRRVKKYREERREAFLDISQLTRLGAAIEEAERTGTASASVVGAIRLLLFTGCRLSEILTLRWSEVDLERRCLRLSDSKTGRKVIHLNGPALAVLDALPRKEGNPYVVPGLKPGSHLVNLNKPWRMIRKRAGLDDVRIHDLRHTFASAGAMNGLSLPMLGALLGHSQPSTTNRYAHLAADPVRQANEIIGAVLESAVRTGAAEPEAARHE